MRTTWYAGLLVTAVVSFAACSDDGSSSGSSADDAGGEGASLEAGVVADGPHVSGDGGSGDGSSGDGSGIGGNLFNPAPLPTTLNHVAVSSSDPTIVTATGRTQTCNLGISRNLTFTSGGKSYTGCYSIDASTAPAPSGGRPALFTFNGGTARPPTTAQEASSSGLITSGKAAGWNIIYIGMEEFDRAISDSSLYGFPHDQVNVDYAGAVIDDLVANHGTDPKRVYAAGFSFGSSAPIFLACHLASKFAAVVSMSGVMYGPASDPSLYYFGACSEPTSPVSIMFVVADQAFPPDGNPLQSPNVHISPTHTSLTSLDIADIVSAPASQKYYGVQHAGEGHRC